MIISNKGLIMINKKLIQDIGDKQMDRKDFLKFGGLALVSLVGLKNLLGILNSTDAKKNESNSSAQPKVDDSYGGTNYGG
jgi:hypothetical protein